MADAKIDNSNKKIYVSMDGKFWYELKMSDLPNLQRRWQFVRMEDYVKREECIRECMEEVRRTIMGQERLCTTNPLIRQDDLLAALDEIEGEMKQ